MTAYTINTVSTAVFGEKNGVWFKIQNGRATRMDCKPAGELSVMDLSIFPTIRRILTNA